MSREKPIKEKTKTRQGKSGKSAKEKKQEIKPPKVVRDSFTMPLADYEQLKALKKMCLTKGVSIKKGELLRAGIMALAEMQSSELLTLLEKVEKVKTGRPAKDKSNNSGIETSHKLERNQEV